MCADHASPFRMPVSSDTAYVSGSSRATTLDGRRQLFDRDEEPGHRDHRVKDEAAYRLREPGRRDHAGDQEPERERAQRGEQQRRVNPATGTSRLTG